MNKFPLIKYACFFICGILFESIANLKIDVILSIFIPVLILTLLTYFYKSHLSPKILCFTLLLFLFLTGVIHYSLFRNERALYPFDEPVIKNALLKGKVTGIELIRDDRLIFYLEAADDSLSGAGLNFLCVVKNRSSAKDRSSLLEKLYAELKVGNEIEMSGTIMVARGKRNPGEFDYGKYLNEKGINALVYVYSVDDLKITSSAAMFPGQIIHEARKLIDYKIISLHNKTTGALLRGLLLGDRGMIDYEISDQFINSGVVHVLSVSGLHVGFIILIFILLFKRFTPYVRLTLTVAGLLFYMVITNLQAPVTRSTVMGLILLSGSYTARSTNNLNSLMLAAIVILLFAPDELFNPGFQLSFTAVASIILIYPRLSAAILKMKIQSEPLRKFLLFISVSFAAQIGTIPFTLVYFHKLSLVSIVANIFVIPLSGLLVAMGITAVVAGFILPAAGLIFSSTNELITYTMYSLVSFFGKPEISFIRINEFSLYDGLLFYSAIAAFAFINKVFASIKRKLAAYALLVTTLFFLFRLDNYQLMPDNYFSVVAIDVGQGDSFLLKFPDGRTALIDAGDATGSFDNGRRVVAPLLDRLGIDKIDVGFISHVDADHYKGFVHLIRDGRIKEIYKPPPEGKNNAEEKLEKFIRAHGIPVNYYSKRNIQAGGVKIYILNDTSDFRFKGLDGNDKSGVFKILFGRTSFLFTGDAGLRAEDYYIERYAGFLKSSVLKAGHHGSKTSTGEAFLQAVKPACVLISAGVANKFDHPHSEVVEMLEKMKIEILRTDRAGAVILRSDGQRIEIIDWKKLESRFIF